ncbi:divergent PAP2 family protein [Candidatus Saccharibacteria bacterium TM7i]|nr:divergent PAP2 family protein [Candidatus Saccharibacteria bacterium TM7i]
MAIFSPYIIAGILGWVVAQTAKYLIISAKRGRFVSPRQLYGSGNMPSAHSATVVGVLTVIGLIDGITSGLFGLALVFASVVLYDAVMVRRSSGEQGASLTALIKEQKSAVRLPRVAKGHTPLEVAVGAFVGVLVGMAAYALHISTNGMF